MVRWLFQGIDYLPAIAGGRVKYTTVKYTRQCAYLTKHFSRKSIISQQSTVFYAAVGGVKRTYRMDMEYIFEEDGK
jgi:hypothetical protein